MIEASLVVTLTIVIAHGFGWLPNFITTPQFDETVQARCLFCRVITCAPRNHAYSICQQASHFYNSLFRTSLYSGAHCHIGSVQRFSSKAVLLLDVPYNPWIEWWTVSAISCEFICRKAFKFHISIILEKKKKKTVRPCNNLSINLTSASKKCNHLLPVLTTLNIGHLCGVHDVKSLTGLWEFVGRYSVFLVWLDPWKFA